MLGKDELETSNSQVDAEEERGRYTAQPRPLLDFTCRRQINPELDASEFRKHVAKPRYVWFTNLTRRRSTNAKVVKQ